MTDRVETGPLEISRRFATIGVVVLLGLCVALLTKQALVYEIASQDACSYYLPLAQAAADGNFADGQHIIIPPVYPIVIGEVSHLFSWADNPLQSAGQFVNGLCAAILVVLVYHIGRCIWTRRVGLAAAALTAANLWVIRLACEVGPELPYAVFIAGATLALISYLQSPPKLWRVSLAAVCAALAALTRSEGIFLPPLVGLILLIAAVRAKPDRAKRIGHLLIFVLVVTAIFSPRIKFINDRTGYPVLDVRLVQAFGVTTDEIGRDLFDPPHTDKIVAIGEGWVTKDISEKLQEAGETFVGVFGPATLAFMIAFWILGYQGLARRRWQQFIILLVVAAQLLMVVRVKMGHRYVVTVTGLVQIWGGLGMVSLSEYLRKRTGRAGQFGKSIPRQMIAMGMLVAGMALWSVLSTNAGTRHTELRDLGLMAREMAGPGKLFVTTSDQVPYYAGGRTIKIITDNMPKNILTKIQLQDICAEYDADFIVWSAEENWCPWLAEQLENNVIATAGGPENRQDEVFLVDARKLFGR